MRSEKGITLTSLIIYIIVLSMVIGTVATITRSTRRNLESNVSEVSNEEYLRFIQYLTEDINSIDFKELFIGENNEYVKIVFLDKSSHVYIYKNETIFYIAFDKNQVIKKQVTLCNEVSDCEFTINDNKFKTMITINDKTYNNYYYINNE